MKILIAGGGSVGRFIAEQLASSEHDVTICDNDTSVVNQYRDRNEPEGVTWFLGDACDITILGAAGAGEADVVVAATGDDEDNLVVSLLSKQEHGAPRVVARVNNPKNEWMFNDMWGVDVSVSTPHLITGLVEEAVNVGQVVRLLAFEGGKARMLEVTLADDSPARDKAIGSLAMPRDLVVVAVVRLGKVVSPSDDLVLRAGDEVLVLTHDATEEEVEGVFVA
ncbi:MAG: potassium channel family protein [Ilumatobacteraceae bacterium]|nr:TrkA family potassium uptake protein [Actinomycetota bacterium]MDA3011575.1 TrkA family potassium uptake protein [Actinomycetota bacterium]MDA3024880.1 TrkA family potassium uptake protein [Actinomycetota bacterium]